MARTIHYLSTNHDRSLDGSSTHEHTPLTLSIPAEQPSTTTAHKKHKKTCWLLRLPPEITYQILIELDPKSLFRVEAVCKDLRGLLAQPYVWCNVISRILERPYLDLPLTSVEARGVLKFFTTRKKKCDLCEKDGTEFLLSFQRLCHEHRESETVKSVEKLRKHALDIMGRRTRQAGIHRKEVTNDFVTIVQRVFPLFQRGTERQARRSIPLIRALWADAQLAWDQLERKDDVGAKVLLSDLHVACGECKDKEAHTQLQDVYNNYEAVGKEVVERAEIYLDLSLNIDNKEDDAALKARKEAGKQARREEFQRRLEALGYPAADVATVLDSYLRRCSRYGRLTDREFQSRLQRLEELLNNCKRLRLDTYRPVRINIVAGAILDVFATNHPDTRPAAMLAVLEFLQITPYTGWCRQLSELIDAESFDTPEDRESLRDQVYNLLYKDTHVSPCILDTTVALCVWRGDLILPPHLPTPGPLCTAYGSPSSQLTQFFGSDTLPHSSS